MVTKVSTDFAGMASVNPFSGSPYSAPSVLNGALKIVNGVGLQVVTAATDSWIYDSVNSYPSAQWCKWVVGAAGGKDFGGILNCVAAGTAYSVTMAAVGGNVSLYKVTAGSFVQAATVAGTYTTGDTWYMENVAGVIKVSMVLPTPQNYITYTDTPTPLTGGAPGISMYDGTGAIASFQAGDFTTGGLRRVLVDSTLSGMQGMGSFTNTLQRVARYVKCRGIFVPLAYNLNGV